MQHFRTFFHVFLLTFIVSGFAIAGNQDKNKSKIFDNSKRLETFDEGEDSDNPRLREKFFHDQRAYPFGEIPFHARAKAAEQTNVMSAKKKNVGGLLSPAPQWTLIGPSQVGGRCNTLAVHPTKPEVAYVGSVHGGVWKTTNSGLSWTPIMDFMNAITFGSIAIDPNNPDVIYAATGEPNSSADSYSGDGVYKSIDGGATWKSVGLNLVGTFSKIYVHPMNSNLVVAAAHSGNQGFYKSTDAGATWTRMSKETLTDLTINAKNPNEFFVGVSGKGVFSTTDGGNTWNTTSATINKQRLVPPGSITFGRVSVQQSRSNPDILFCLVDYNANGDAYIYKSSNHGVTWSIVLPSTLRTGFFSSGGNSQAFYDNYIEIDPTNPLNILAGGSIYVYGSTDGGSTWNKDGGLHPDQHHAAFAQSNSSIVYECNDGGVYVSKSSGKKGTFSVINNGLAITQFYAMDIDQKASNIVYGGAQDNGTLSNSSIQYGDIGGGDGFFVAVDNSNSNIVYYEVYYGTMFKKNLSSGATNTIVNGIDANDQGAWSSPIRMDPKNSQVLYHGRHSLYKTTNGGSNWFASSDPNSATISAIGVSPVNSDVVYYGTAESDLFVSKDGGDSWIDISVNGLPNRAINYIACSPTDAGTAYLALSGFYSGHLFKTLNYGASWTDISTTLPDIPINAIAIHPTKSNVVFIGTDVGVFEGIEGDGVVNWSPFGVGLPRTTVTDMQFHKSTGKLRVATYGRSMWEALVPDAVDGIAITSPAGGEGYVGLSQQILSWYGFTGTVKIDFALNAQAPWQSVATGIAGNSYLWTVPNTPTLQGIIRVTSEQLSDQSLISRTFSIFYKSPLDTGIISGQGSVSFIPYGLTYDGKNGLWVTSLLAKKLYYLNSKTYKVEKIVPLKVDGIADLQDSLYLDITMDKATQTIYVHKAKDPIGNGGQIVTVDTNGNILNQIYRSLPKVTYPIGLTLVDAGVLIEGDRDGSQKLYAIDATSGAEYGSYTNPFNKPYGPRGLCFDGNQYVYQVCTEFSSATANSQFIACYVMKMDKDNLSKEVARFELKDEAGNYLNARGIEYDPRDKMFWITEYGGRIFKMVGFDKPIIDTTLAVSDKPVFTPNEILTLGENVPNPFEDVTRLSFNLAHTALVRVELFNTAGLHIASLLEGQMPEGYNSIVLNGTGLPSGIYTVVYSIQNSVIKTQKVVLLR